MHANTDEHFSMQSSSGTGTAEAEKLGRREAWTRAGVMVRLVLRGASATEAGTTDAMVRREAWCRESMTSRPVHAGFCFWDRPGIARVFLEMKGECSKPRS